jgi:hypothetical protein
MEKTLTIEGREVRFKSTAALPLIYNEQFGRDLFNDINSLSGKKVDTQLLYSLVWAMAKCADPSIPPFMDWFGAFEAFPIFPIFTELSGMALSTFKGTVKNPVAAVEP